jgi:hypothetical protein
MARDMSMCAERYFERLAKRLHAAERTIKGCVLCVCCLQSLQERHSDQSIIVVLELFYSNVSGCTGAPRLRIVFQISNCHVVIHNLDPYFVTNTEHSHGTATSV